jgi:hypothetical protein
MSLLQQGDFSGWGKRATGGKVLQAAPLFVVLVPYLRHKLGCTNLRRVPLTFVPRQGRAQSDGRDAIAPEGGVRTSFQIWFP